MAAKKWRHSATLIHTKGKVKVTCACGKQSAKVDSEEEALAWHVTHTKLIEKQRKREEEW